MPLGAIAGGVAGLAGSLIGNSTANNAMDAAQAATQKAVDAINAVGASPDLAKQIFLQQYQQAGILTPEIEQNINSHFQQIAGPSSQVTNAQSSVLGKLAQQSQSGLTPQDRLALAQIQQESARQNQAAQGAITQNLAERGLTSAGTSGSEIAQRMIAAQGAGNNAAMQGLQVGAQSGQAALQALAAEGSQANAMNSQQFSQNQAQANIQNEQNRFNTQNQLNTQQQNVQAQNAAQAANLANKQAISNANTSQANQEAQREVQAQQTMYQNAMAHAQGVANAYTGQGQQAAQFGQNKAGATTGMFGGLASAAAGLGSYYNNQSNNEQQQNNFNSLLGVLGGNQSGSTDNGTGIVSGYNPNSFNGVLSSSQNPSYSNSGIPTSSYVTAWQGGLIQKLSDGGVVNTIPAGYNSGGYVENEYFTGGPVKDMRSGGPVPGHAKVPGDSPQNDTVKAMLSPGEYVIPRSEMAKIKSPDIDLDHAYLRDLLKTHETSQKAMKKMAKGGNVHSQMPQIQQPMQGMRPQMPMQNPTSGAGLLAQLIAPGLQKGAGQQMQPVKRMSDGGPVYSGDDYSYDQQGYADGGTVGGIDPIKAQDFSNSLMKALGQPTPTPTPIPQGYDEGGEVDNGTPGAMSTESGPQVPNQGGNFSPEILAFLAKLKASQSPQEITGGMSLPDGSTTEGNLPGKNPQILDANNLGYSLAAKKAQEDATPKREIADDSEDTSDDSDEEPKISSSPESAPEQKPDMAPMQAKTSPDYLAMLKSAQSTSNDNMLNANLLKAYQQSLGAAGRRPADYSLADSLEKQANAPVDQLSQQVKFQDAAQKMAFNKEMDDPNSKTSQFTQALAVKYGIDQNKVNGVPASAISKLIPAIGTASYREALINSRNLASGAKNDKSQNKDLNGFITKARSEGLKQQAASDELNKSVNILEEGIKNPNSINDLASFYASAKAFNPKSIVRSQSVKLEQQAMGPWKNLENKINAIAGGQVRLSDTGVQKDMLASISKLKDIADKDKQTYQDAVIQQGKKGYNLPDERINEIFPSYNKSSEEPGMSSQNNSSGNSHPQDSDAVTWAKANPKDPRAAKILQLNGGQ